MSLLDYAKIIGRAAYVRNKAGLDGTDPPYSMHKIMEVFPDIAVTGADLPPAITEMAVAESKGGSTRRALFYNRNVHHPAQRTGLAHGLYHHLTDIRGEVGLRECNVAMRSLGDRIPDFRDPVELACDLFAAELLMPLDVLDRYAPDPLWGRGAMPASALADEFDTIASRFNVPRGFAKWRCFDLHALRQSHYNPAK